ncbi:MAG: TlpA disulfide reductase family protein [Acidobacteriota bacterium]
MIGFTKRFVATGFAGLLTLCTLLPAGAKTPPPPKTDNAPEMKVPHISPDTAAITIETLGGKKVTLAELTGGKPTMLVFWASWCPDCRRETPKVKAAYARFRAKGLNLIAVDSAWKNETPSAAKKYIREHDLKYPVYFDASQDAGKAYGLKWIPTVILLNREGKIVFKAPHVSFKAIQSLLAEKKTGSK